MPLIRLQDKTHTHTYTPGRERSRKHRESTTGGQPRQNKPRLYTQTETREKGEKKRAIRQRKKRWNTATGTEDDGLRGTGTMQRRSKMCQEKMFGCLR